MRETRKTRSSRMALGCLVALIAAAGVAAQAEEPVASQEPEPTAVGQIEERAETGVAPRLLERPRLAGGLQAHIDPDTGALVVPPLKARQELQLSPELMDALSTSHDGLHAVTLPNGLTYVDLQGRFRSATFATVGEDGEVTIHHSGPPAPAPPATADAEPSAREETP